MQWKLIKYHTIINQNVFLEALITEQFQELTIAVHI